MILSLSKFALVVSYLIGDMGAGTVLEAVKFSLLVLVLEFSKFCIGGVKLGDTDTVLEAHKVNSTVALMKYINFTPQGLFLTHRI